jgi:hypothetical protein
MLDAATKGKMAAAFSTAIVTLGVPCRWSSTRTPGQTATMTIGCRTAGNQDQEIINAYGIGTLILTARAVDFPIPPEKFDVFTIGADTAVANAVHEVRLNDLLIGFKIYARVS